MGWLSKQMNSITKRLGGGSTPNPRAESRAAEARELQRLKSRELRKQLESRFLQEEGAGKRRETQLSFGDEFEQEQMSADERSLRSTGKFAKNRLVL